MIEELTKSHSINSEYGQFVTSEIQEFLRKQRDLKSKIQNDKDYCLNLIVAEINSVFNPSITELNILNSLIKKIPDLEKTLQKSIEKKKARHLRLTEELNISELGLSGEIRKQFANLQEKFDNQTKRIELTFGLN